MNKDVWDKISVIATFIQIVVIGGFAVVVSFYSARMSNKLNTYKSGMDENTMIAKLVQELTNDTVSTVQTDFALLSLERYLKSSQDGDLKPYDKDMLTGFAQSIILNRFINTDNKDLDKQLGKVFIEKNFLNKTNSLAYDSVWTVVQGTSIKQVLPPTSNVAVAAPIFQVVDTTKTQALSVLSKKTCYIQIAGEAQRPKAEDLQKKLKEKAWYAPGIQVVPGNYQNIIKYFHDEDTQLAENVKALLNEGASFSVVATKGYQSKAPRGQLEIWISN